MKNKWSLIILFLLIPAFACSQDISFLIGSATENSRNEKSTAWQVEYNYRFPCLAGFSLSYLNEGGVPFHKRDGFAAQFRIFAPIPSDRFSLSISGGPYRWYDTQLTTIARGWAGLYGVTGSYAITESVIAKVTWNRVESNDNRDSDIFLIGLGYCWK